MPLSRPMRRVSALVAFAALVGLGSGAFAKGVQVELDYIDVSLAPQFNVYVDYLNEAGKPILGLEPKDLALMLDGERWEDELTVTPFSGSDEGVAYIILVSTYPGFSPAFDPQKKGLAAFIGGMRDQEQAALYSYGESVNPLVDFTNDKDELKTALRSVEPTTRPINAFLDAVVAALDAFPAQDPTFPRRRGIVMMADAMDQGLENKRAIAQRIKNDLAPKARALGVKFYSLGYTQESEQGLRIMGMLQSKFGGSYRRLRRTELQRADGFFREILERVHGQYIVQFETTSLDPEETHTLQINVNHQGKPIESTPVEFQPPPVDGVRWWVILLIVLGGMAGVGSIVLVIVLIAGRGKDEEEEEEDYDEPERACPLCGMPIPPGLRTCQPCLSIPHEAQLTVRGGDLDGFIYPIRGTSVTIGSREGEIRVPDASVSGKHASLNIDSTKYELADLNSTNGTYVNSKRVTKRFLRNGDSLRCGNVEMMFKLT